MPFNTGIQSGVALGNAEFGLHLKKKATSYRQCFERVWCSEFFKNISLLCK